METRSKSAGTKRNGECLEHKLAISSKTSAQDVWEATVNIFFPSSRYDKLDVRAASDVDTAVVLRDMLESTPPMHTCCRTTLISGRLT